MTNRKHWDDLIKEHNCHTYAYYENESKRAFGFNDSYMDYLEKKLNIATEALEFYADDSVWKGTYFGDDDYYEPAASPDKGRQALREIKEG